MAVEGKCHCGAVRLILQHPPSKLIACNCSLCSRRGMLWARYPRSEVATQGYTEDYCWGDKTISFCHCPVCGCTTHWYSLKRDGGDVGVNARLVDGFEEIGGISASRYSFRGDAVPVQLLEGANG